MDDIDLDPESIVSFRNAGMIDGKEFTHEQLERLASLDNEDQKFLTLADRFNNSEKLGSLLD